MRIAREAKGISLRAMASRLGYRAHSVLVEFENGHRMATEDAVRGYERILGLAPGTLLEKREQLISNSAQDGAGPIRRPRGTAGSGTTRVPRSRWPLGIAALVVGVILIGSIGVDLFVASRSTPTSSPTVAPSLTPVATAESTSAELATDGSDPSETGCDKDAITVSQVDVVEGEAKAGLLELRNSPSCGTSWGKFTPQLGLSTTPQLTIDLVAHRPADQAVAPYTIVFPGEGVFGDQLRSTDGCVYVSIVLAREAGDRSVAQTDCVGSATSPSPSG